MEALPSSSRTWMWATARQPSSSCKRLRNLLWFNGHVGRVFLRRPRASGGHCDDPLVHSVASLLVPHDTTFRDRHIKASVPVLGNKRSDPALRIMTPSEEIKKSTITLHHHAPEREVWNPRERHQCRPEKALPPTPDHPSSQPRVHPRIRNSAHIQANSAYGRILRL